MSDFGDWNDDWDFEINKDLNEKSNKNELTSEQKWCYHDWVPVVLIISTKYHCKKCNVKKEEVE